MSPSQEHRRTVTELVRAVPFHPFFLSLQDGKQVNVKHPENIAYQADGPDGTGGTTWVHVVDDGVFVRTTFDAITSVVQTDIGQTADAA